MLEAALSFHFKSLQADEDDTLRFDVQCTELAQALSVLIAHKFATLLHGGSVNAGLRLSP